jgi:hypothetical protein
MVMEYCGSVSLGKWMLLLTVRNTIAKESQGRMFPEPVPRHAVPGKREPVVRSCSLFDGVGEEWSFNILLNSIDEWEGSLDPRMTSPASADPFEWGPRWIWTDDMDVAFFFFSLDMKHVIANKVVKSSHREDWCSRELVIVRPMQAATPLPLTIRGTVKPTGRPSSRLLHACLGVRGALGSDSRCERKRSSFPFHPVVAANRFASLGGEATSTRSKMTLRTSRRANGNPPF